MWRKTAQTTGENLVPLGAMRRWGGAGEGGSGSPETPMAPSSSSSAPQYGVPTNGSIQGAGGPDAYGSGSAYSRHDSVGDANRLKRERDDAVAMGAAAAAAAVSGGTQASAADGADGSGENGWLLSDLTGNALTLMLSCTAPRKRRSRWGDEKTNLGVVTALGANVSEAELERYALNVRIEEIAGKLRSGDVVPPERERSPSPPPTYDAHGHRTNTREVRYRKKMEEERVRLVDKQIKLDPNYRPPAEYVAAKRNMKPHEKVFLPIQDFPEINFFGLLVGPRGNTLKGMEAKSGAKISIRGKGSVKSGKGRMEEENEEEMHCVVTADDEEKVRKCVKLINLVIETAASTPEAQNDHKRNQLRELASLNGTLRDDENQVCQNCGQKGHRKYECPEQRNWTAHIVCHRCGQQGHLARDCTSAPGGGMGRPGMGGPGGMMGGGGAPGRPSGVPNGDPFNSEYENLMAELGEGDRSSNPSAGGAGPSAGAPGAGVAPGGPMDRPIGPDGKKIPPWRDPSMWNQPVAFGGGGPPRGPRFGGGMGFGGPQGGFYNQQQQWGQQGGHDWNQQQAAWAQQQQQQPGQMAGGAQPPTGPAADQQQQQQQSGQPDYREAWEAYYRSQGMDAAAAAAAASAAGTGGATGQAQQQDATAAATAAGANGQPDYSKEWEE